VPTKQAVIVITTTAIFKNIVGCDKKNITGKNFTGSIKALSPDEIFF